MNQLIVFGGGRMGLSHAAMAGLLDSNMRILLVEPNFKTRMVLKMVTGRGVRVISQANMADIKMMTHAVIATPPSIHKRNFDQLHDAGFRGRLLIEKPVTVGETDLSSFGDEMMSGYVMRHAYFWGWMKEVLAADVVRKVSVRLETNQDFRPQAAGWRVQESISGLSLLSEFGSHCINLLIDLVPVENISLISSDMNHVVLAVSENSDCTIELCAKSANVRKSVYTVYVETETARYSTDFYSFTKNLDDGSVALSSSLAAEGVSALAYLRGLEFSTQMETFLGGEPLDPKDITDAIATDRLISKLEEVMRCQK
jgi:predicted dehydrogenase